VAKKRLWLDREAKALSLRRQCHLLGLNWSSLHYHPKGESELNLLLMHALDEQYTRTPFYGVCKMTESVRQLGYPVNEKRVRRLLRQMGLEAVYPKPKLSTSHPEHKVFPYLLRGVPITRCNQVWSTDITYIRLTQGFVYLMAIMDWYSRYVLTWAFSTTLEAEFCIEALAELLERSHCEIFNSDQGSQFTPTRFTELLLAQDIQVSMDGRGRVFDNIFVERLWRTVKYEKVYLSDFQSVPEAYTELRTYFEFYNHERLHQALDYRTPAQVYGTP